MKNIRRFEASTKTLLRLMDEQMEALDRDDKEKFEQCRLSILSTIEQIKISINGEPLEDAQLIFI